jgi:hypothetical protein
MPRPLYCPPSLHLLGRVDALSDATELHLRKLAGLFNGHDAEPADLNPAALARRVAILDDEGLQARRDGYLSMPMISAFLINGRQLNRATT